MKLSLWCLMHYCDFDSLIADKAIAINEVVAECDALLKQGDKLTLFYKHIGLRFEVVSQGDIDSAKTWEKAK